jgi:hypothetical protein
MQKGAAYFGLAGFDVHDVINSFSKTGVLTTTTNTQTDLSVYMSALVNDATGTSLTYMDNAVGAYSNVTTTSTTGSYTSDNYKDAQFYISLVDAVKSLSLIKLVIPNLLNPSGSLNTSCDYNDNGVPDDGDATACALIAAARISTSATETCTGATYAPAAPVDITLTDASGQPVPGTYSGLTINITQVAGGSAALCIPANTTSYKKLLYKTMTLPAQYWVATTTSDLCTGSDGNTWPCPIVQNSQPLDLVSAVDQTLTSSITSLNSSLTTSATGTSTTDIQTAIQDIKGQACCGCTTTPCAPCTTSCTSQDIANYIQTNLK